MTRGPSGLPIYATLEVREVHADADGLLTREGRTWYKLPMNHPIARCSRGNHNVGSLLTFQEHVSNLPETPATPVQPGGAAPLPARAAMRSRNRPGSKRPAESRASLHAKRSRVKKKNQPTPAPSTSRPQQRRVQTDNKQKTKKTSEQTCWQRELACLASDVTQPSDCHRKCFGRFADHYEAKSGESSDSASRSFESHSELLDGSLGTSEGGSQDSDSDVSLSSAEGEITDSQYDAFRHECCMYD